MTRRYRRHTLVQEVMNVPGKHAQGTRPIGAHVDTAQYARLSRLAAARGLTLAQALREALDLWAREEESGDTASPRDPGRA